jgi:hypothetical protein
VDIEEVSLGRSTWLTANSLRGQGEFNEITVTTGEVPKLATLGTNVLNIPNRSQIR